MFVGYHAYGLCVCICVRSSPPYCVFPTLEPFPSPFIEHSGGVARLDAGGRLDESLDKIQGASTNVRSTLTSERNGVLENHFLVNEKKGHFLTSIILIISLFSFVEFIGH